MSLLRSLVACSAALVCVAALAAPVNERRMLEAAQDRADWLTHGRTYDEQRFSPLAAIDQKLAELPPGSRVLGFNYDTGERYLSVPDFLPEI